MEWKLFDENRNFLQEVNCQYDACDFASMFYGATRLEIDFNRKEATIVEREEVQKY